jgi:hypothetical protein
MIPGYTFIVDEKAAADLYARLINKVMLGKALWVVEWACS